MLLVHYLHWILFNCEDKSSHSKSDSGWSSKLDSSLDGRGSRSLRTSGGGGSSAQSRFKRGQREDKVFKLLSVLLTFVMHGLFFFLLFFRSLVGGSSPITLRMGREEKMGERNHPLSHSTTSSTSLSPLQRDVILGEGLCPHLSDTDAETLTPITRKSFFKQSESRI